MEDTLSERLMAVMSHFELTPNAFAKKSSIDPSHWNKMLKGELPITKKSWEKISYAFPQVSIEWLKTGEGDMLRDAPPVSASPGTSSSVAELLAIIRSQQETIRSLSETVGNLSAKISK